MPEQNFLRRVRGCLARRFGPWLLVATVVAGVNARGAEAQFTGTAFQALRRVSHADGDTRSPGRVIFEGLVATCNQQRAAFYGAPAVQPAAAELERLDSQRIEKYFDNGRAATHVHSTLLTLPDHRRWQEALRTAGGVKPPRPPDCSAVTAQVFHTATLWLDGVKYELDYDRGRGTARRGGVDFVPRQLVSERDFDAAPAQLESGQSCREPALPASGFLSGAACLWTAFPPVAWLNFPWALRAERRLGAPGKLVSVDTLVAIERNRAIPEDRITVPKGFALAGQLSPPQP